MPRGARLLALGCLTTASLGALIATAPASTAAPAGTKAPIVTYGFSSGTVTVSSHGHKWNLSLSLFGQPAFEAITIGIAAPRGGGLEEHSWDLQAPHGSFSFHASTRKATLNAKMAPVATVKLAFKGTSAAKESCASGHGTIYTGTLAGSVTLHTGFSSEPTLGGSHLTFQRVNSLIVSSGCTSPGLPCQTSSWNASSFTASGAVFADGVTVGSPRRPVHQADVERIVVLSSPKNAQRTDEAVMTIHAPKFNSARKSLSVTTSSRGIVTGSATIGHSKAVHIADPFICQIGRARYTDHGIVYFSASYTSPGGKRLKAHILLGGTLAVPASGGGDFTNYFLKRS